LRFAQAARTSLSVANSPRAAAAREAAIAARSSAVEAIGAGGFQHQPRNLVLHLGRKASRGFHGPIEQSRHAK
jgi:hypothetical protein